MIINIGVLRYQKERSTPLERVLCRNPESWIIDIVVARMWPRKAGQAVI